VTDVDALAAFDFAAFFAAVDDARRDRNMGWYDLANELWEQSAQLNAERGDHPLCGGAVSRLGARGETSCQYALYLLRWLGQAPEEFLTGPAAEFIHPREQPTASRTALAIRYRQELGGTLSAGRACAEVAHDGQSRRRYSRCGKPASPAGIRC
jgi:hypothetical protein